MYSNAEPNVRRWFRIVHPDTKEVHVFDLAEVGGGSRSKRGDLMIHLKNGGRIVVKAGRRHKWLDDTWKRFMAETIGVPIYSYWALRKTK